MATTLTPLDPRGTVLGDEVYATLGEAILDGTLPPGERLRDHELAARLGVSRTPVREALQRLERAGLVEVSPNRYTRVSAPNAKVMADTTEFFVHTIGSCVRIAVNRCDDEKLALMLTCTDAVIDASRRDDRLAIMAASTRLFTIAAHATNNVAFLRVLREAEIAIRRNLAQWRPAISCPITRTDAYEQFREAVAARRGDRAEAILLEVHGRA